MKQEEAVEANMIWVQKVENRVFPRSEENKLGRQLGIRVDG